MTHIKSVSFLPETVVVLSYSSLVFKTSDEGNKSLELLQLFSTTVSMQTLF